MTDIFKATKFWIYIMSYSNTFTLHNYSFSKQIRDRCVTFRLHKSQFWSWGSNHYRSIDLYNLKYERCLEIRVPTSKYIILKWKRFWQQRVGWILNKREKVVKKKKTSHGSSGKNANKNGTSWSRGGWECIVKVKPQETDVKENQLPGGYTIQVETTCHQN